MVSRVFPLVERAVLTCQISHFPNKVNRKPGSRNANTAYLNSKWSAVNLITRGSSLSQKLVDVEIWQIVGVL